MLHHGLRCVGRRTVTLKCDNEPAIFPPLQEIRRLRREGSITIFEHPEEGEEQTNHLAEGSVNIVKGLKDRDWPVSSVDTWIIN